VKENKVAHKRVWILVAVVVLIAVHGAFLYLISGHLTYISSHAPLSAKIGAGIVLLVAIKLIVSKHRGLPVPLHDLFRRRRRH